MTREEKAAYQKIYRIEYEQRPYVKAKRKAYCKTETARRLHRERERKYSQKPEAKAKEALRKKNSVRYHLWKTSTLARTAHALRQRKYVAKTQFFTALALTEAMQQ